MKCECGCGQETRLKNKKPQRFLRGHSSLSNWVGRPFGRLTVIARARTIKSNGRNDVIWLCRCTCENTAEVYATHLSRGRTKSCGCARRESSRRIGEQNLSHGHCRRLEGHASRTYQSWKAMCQRCLNPNDTNYHLYGGAGVTICDRWLKFENFLADMGERPPGTTLSRFGDVGNYCKANCAWHTPKQQRAEARKKIGHL